MKILKPLILISFLLALSLSQEICRENDSHLLNDLKKGMTYQVEQWPIQSNNWAGRIGCKGCDAIKGDEPCTSVLPVLCILHPKVIDRPSYAFSNLARPYENPDRSYYNGWTGGIFTVTPPVRGYDVDSYEAGDKLCKDYWGKSVKFAEFKDGYYQSEMNTRPVKAWKFWNWKEAICGGWAFWGYFNTNYNGRVWTWNESQARSNCGAQ